MEKTNRNIEENKMCSECHKESPQVIKVDLTKAINNGTIKYYCLGCAGKKILHTIVKLENANYEISLKKSRIENLNEEMEKIKNR